MSGQKEGMNENVERVSRLEERMAWLERHVVAQDRAMLELSEQCDRLKRELVLVRERGAAGASGSGGVEPQERPPHY